MIIDPSVPLQDPEASAALERKRQELLRGPYRPKVMKAEWPKPDELKPDGWPHKFALPDA
jgi:hypothetical protein